MYLLTPSTWNTHNYAYASNENHMLDWKVNIVEKKYRNYVTIEDIEEDPMMVAFLQVSSI